MPKFGSVEEAAKALAAGEFNRVSPPPTAEKKSSRRGAIGAKTVEDATAKQKVNLKRSETTLERKRRAPPAPPSATVSPPAVHAPKIKKLVVAIPPAEGRLPILPELSTTPTEIAKAMDPSFDTYQRLKTFDAETLRNAIIAVLPLKDQLAVIQAYSEYTRITTPKPAAEANTSSEYAIPSTIY